jgi:hypothetical protein
MADNTTLNTGTGGDVIATDDIAGVKHQRVKIEHGADGSATDVSTASPLPTVLQTAQAADGAASQPATAVAVGGFDGTNFQMLVTDSAGRANVNVNGAVPVTDNAGSLTVDDGAGSLTVDAPVGTPVFVRLSDGSAAIATLPVSLASLPALAAGTNLVGRVQLDAATANGATPATYVSAASTNATSVKASAGQVYGVLLSNVNAAARYLKIFNKASAPTVGTDTPVMNLIIPGNAAGAGSNVFLPVGAAFSTGIAFAITTGVALLDTGAVAANEITATFLYA